ncbi:putative actinorhodin transporter [Actinorhabdospora filicis]|uniref:Actinorhodin transporter n=1 Tax=Actinorhabdospora filicis TaxID=1785913 RepID=A0A9W6SJK5_9ACTN|nr:DHA2 family efflux MFS transporter permease subunit [Actinorhabdospora filicis]GLZ75821.1 putative actinorhodin transporter [Actinorhabdospora filicis]
MSVAAEETRAPETAPAHRLRWAALAVLLIAEIMDLLDGTIVNVAGPSIREGVGGGLSTLQWVMAAYSLALAVGLMIGGRLGDILGRKRMFIIGAAGFTAASALCAIAQGPATLIGARLLQGLLGAIMIPQGMGLIRHMFKGKELAAAFGVFGPAMGLAAMAGPLLGGWLVDADLFGTGWRAIFLINLPLGLAVILAGLKLLPEAKLPDSPRLDVLGAILASAGAFLAVYPLVQGREEDWPAWTWISLAASVVVFALLALHQRHRVTKGRDPLIEPGIFRSRAFVSGVLVTTVFFGAMIGVMLVFNLFAQMSLGFDAFDAGLSLAPWSLGTALGAIAGGGLAAKVGRPVLHVGLLVMIGGMLLLWNTLGNLPADPSPWTFALGTGVSGIGMGMVFAPLFSIVLNAVGDREIGSASGVLTSIQQFGGAAGAAGIGTLFFELIGPMDTPSYVPAVRDTMLVCAALLGLVFLLGFLLPRKARADVH